MFSFKKSEFYSDLKQRAVSNNDYESTFYLYRTLKMRNLGHINDLYNAQDKLYFVKQLKTDFSLCMMKMVLTEENVTQQVL